MRARLASHAPRKLSTELSMPYVLRQVVATEPVGPTLLVESSPLVFMPARDLSCRSTHYPIRERNSDAEGRCQDLDHPLSSNLGTAESKPTHVLGLDRICRGTGKARGAASCRRDIESIEN